LLGYFTTLALAQAWRYRLQTLLIVLAVGIGIANVIVLISMTDLGRRQTMGLIKDFGARVILVTPFIDFSGGPFAMFSPANTNGFLPPGLLEAVQKSSVIDPGEKGGACSMLILPSNVELLPENAPADAQPSGDLPAHYSTLAGVTHDFINLGGTSVVAGRWLTPEETASGAKVVCLGSTPLKILFGPQRESHKISEAVEAEGQEEKQADAEAAAAAKKREAEIREAREAIDPKTALGREVLIRGERYTVVGVMIERGKIGFEDVDDRVFIPLPQLQELSGYDGTQLLMLRYREGLKEADAMAEVKSALAAALPEGEALEDSVSVFTIKEATRLVDSTVAIYRAVLWGIGSIALLVAGIGIMNVMLIRVLQRRTEIGLRRACGAPRRSIIQQFIIEASVQALAGALLGVPLGLFGVALFCRYSEWEFYVAPFTIILAISFAAAIGVVFGAYPAARAARVDPIQSLRSEF
jgi:ABC-type antimicrobial peptide transport system permease subunit